VPQNTALVGREAELAAFRGLAHSAVAGRGGVALITGEAGVGKTALVDATLDGEALVVARASASSVASPPFGPVRGLLSVLHRELPEATQELSALALLIPEEGAVEAVHDRPTLLDAIADGLAALARPRPLALVLDDLQWADHATLDLLLPLAKCAARAPLLVVALYRSDAVGRGHPLRTMRDSLRRQRLTTEIALEPLSRADTSLLLTRLLGREPRRELVAAIGERTGGVPFLVEALAAAIRGRETWENLPLPDSVRDAILQGLDHLPAAARRAAETGAAAGSEFPLELLVAVNDGDAGVEALLESGLVVERYPGIAAFRTPLAREVIYAAIPWTRRRLLHRRLAEILEPRGGSVEQLAAHWLAADEPQRARRALLDGAAQARRLFAHRDMVQLLRRALDLWPATESAEDTAQRLDALDQLGDAAQAAGLFADALRAWRDLGESAAAGAHQLLAARALRKIANLHELNCDWGRAVEARQDAMGAFAAAGEHGEAAVEGITAAIRLRLSARHAAGMEVVERAAAEAQASGRADLQVRVAALRGNLEARLGRFAEGIAAIRAALEAALALDQPALVGEIYQRLADAIERSSDFRSGTATNLQGIAFCEERSQAGGIVACLACMSWILVRGGEWAQAASACRQMLGSPACNPGARTVALCNAGLVHMLRGELRKGEPLLLEADALARRLEHALAELICRWGFALRDAIEHGPPAAAERCREILARWRRTDERHASMPILRWSSSVFAQAGDRDGLRACADAFGQSAAAFSHAEPLSALAHVLGEIAWLEGDLARAGDQFEHAVALLDDMQLPRERAESLLRASAARGAAGQREVAVAHVREAARLAERLGARPLWDQAAARLRELGEPLAGALGPRGARRAQHGGLTARQIEIVREISRGLTDKEIARALRLSPRTVEMHVAHALSALGCRSRAEAVRKAGELGVLAPRVP